MSNAWSAMRGVGLATLTSASETWSGCRRHFRLFLTCPCSLQAPQKKPGRSLLKSFSGPGESAGVLLGRLFGAGVLIAESIPATAISATVVFVVI